MTTVLVIIKSYLTYPSLIRSIASSILSIQMIGSMGPNICQNNMNVMKYAVIISYPYLTSSCIIRSSGLTSVMMVGAI